VKSPILLFTLKCSVILYFAACSGIGDYASGVSATPVVTKGIWKVNLYSNADKDNTNEFAGYTFTFNPGGEVKANKNGVEVIGNWSEDDISKKITINLGTKDPVLTKLNDHWNVSAIKKAELVFQNNENTNDRLQITSL
jgi:hypothetical protein